MSLPFVRDTSRTDQSIGRVKSDRRPNAVLDKKFDVDQSEYNELLDAVQEVTHFSPLNRTRFNVFDDFLSLETDASQRWVQTVGSGGALAILNGISVPTEGEGFGWLQLSATSTGGSVAQLVGRHDLISPAANPIARCRVKLPAVLDDASFTFGFEASDLSSFACIGNLSGDWVVQAESSEGGGGVSSETLGTPTPVASQIYDLRVELTNGADIRYFIDDELVFTLDQSVPEDGDLLNLLLRLGQTTDGGVAVVDYAHAEGSR